MTRLVGRTVRLRSMTETDAADVVRWRSDEFVARQLFSSSPPSIEEHLTWFSRMSSSEDRQEFIIVDAKSGVAYGTIGLSNIDRSLGRAEYGVMLGEPSARGRGIAREATELILNYAFKELGLRQIYLNVFSDNERATHLYDSLGFRVDSRSVREKNGEERAVLHMVLDASS